jgi:acetyl-CoA C-acetyltransferase
MNASRQVVVLSGVRTPAGSRSATRSVAATGALITVKALYELARTGGRYALVTMCIGSGQGIACEAVDWRR